MAIPNGIQTAALIAGTVLTAAGLNLGVIGLGEPESSGEPATGNAQPAAMSEAPATDGLVLTAASLEPPALETPPLEEPPAPGLPVATPAPAAGGGSAAPRGATPAPSAGPAPTGAVPAAQPAPTPSGTQPAPAAQPQATPQPAPTQPAPTAPTSSQPQSSPSTTPATAAPTQPAPQPPASQTEYLTYQFDGIAEITVALHDGNRLEFWSAVKAPGWVSRVDDNGPGNVKVKFMRLSDGEEAEFEVKLTGDGDIDVKMEA